MTPEIGKVVPVIAVGYIRRSYESDARTVSLAAQRAVIERYADRHEMPRFVRL